MSMYKELNDVKLDLSVYEEVTLTEVEQKKWEKRVRSKLAKRKTHSKKWLGLAAAVVLTMGVMSPIGKVALAQVTAVAGLIEHFIDNEKQLDYSAYKTAVGETAENKYGKLTLNEVLVDADSLLISSTFEPKQGIAFDTFTTLSPHIYIQGKNVEVTRGTKTIKVSDDMYIIYGTIKLSELPQEEQFQLTISYEEFRMPRLENKSHVIEEPWVFDVQVSPTELRKNTETVQLDKTITLYNGEKVKLEKLMASPVSTMLYYQLNAGLEKTYFKLVSTNGEEIGFRIRYGHDITEASYIQYDPIDVDKEEYFLVPVDENGNKLGESIKL
ncbi:DUF4179 domain-containing protein [Paenibacillus sp. GSMTC-2017]|uniref:DUF4179 domain-containing protein n=1 Tax=Paenibacillus sp. GSMTC-2017 TaxID=2794350 RepID=UPI0018D98ABF|nr:DUF4179 domain-containing protein [Paenibacillus sp. GSMTC-2017]MBH5319636.1 DUF4179 domain-containing protein [Paenibacillus sp. GSMTC-2017]